MKFLDSLSQPSQTMSLYTFPKSATCEKLRTQRELKHSPALKDHFFWKSHHCIRITADVHTNAEYWGVKQVLKPEARTLHSSGAVSQEAAFQLTPMAHLVTEGLFSF